MEAKRYRYARAQFWILVYIAIALTINVAYLIGNHNNWW